MPFLRGLLWALSALGVLNALFSLYVYGAGDSDGVWLAFYILLASVLYLSRQVPTAEGGDENEDPAGR